MEFLRQLFSAEGFMPHGHCYLWNPGVVWLHVISDALIALAYFSIPFTLVYFVRRRKDLAFHWIFLCFALFIVACGTTHLMEIWSVWKPTYWLSGAIKAVTALTSVPTAILLIDLVPKALALPSPEQLRRANAALESEVLVRKRAEDSLVQSSHELDQKNKQLMAAEEAKSEFLANVSHEFRTPLTLILAPLEYLLEKADGPMPATHRNSLKIIHNNAVRLLQMVTGLLDFSKLEAAKVQVRREPVQIVALTRAMLADFEPSLRQKGLRLDFQPTSTEACVQMDHYLYERILFNLVSNAAKFTTYGGAIVISLATQNNRLRLTVADTGIGIPEVQLAHLFQKFRQIESSSTRRFEGTGLGLALVKEFAEMLGGTVTVESEVDRGSSFTVECDAPAVDSPGTSELGTHLPVRYVAESIIGEPAPVAPAGNRPRILIAEDNAELAFYIASLLREFSETKITGDGDEAFRLALEWAPNLVLADVMMPKRDGLTLCRDLKSNPQTARTPVVLLTALTHRESLLKGWETGADEYLFKPFHNEELVTRIRSMLRAAELASRSERELKSAKEELESTVHERTLDLARANRALQAEIDERKRIEVTLRDSEERYRSLVETLPEVVVLVSVGDATILALNLPFEKKTGWPRTDWIGRQYAELIHSDDFDATQSAFQQASRGEWPPRMEVRFRCRSGEYLLCEVIAGPHFQKSRVTGVFACIRDITHRKRDEVALRESEGRLRGLSEDLDRRVQDRTAQLEAANRDLENEIAERKLAEALLRESEERFRLLVLDVKDYAIYWIDPDGRVAGWNAGAERINGYQAGEIIGKPYSVFHSAEDNARGWPAQLLRIALDQGRVQDEGWRVRKDGSRFWANTVITALRGANAELRGFAKIMRDDTERQRSQQALQESKLQLEAANKELEAFSYSVSHDLRAPLRAIDGFALALQEDCADRLDENGRKHLKRVRDAAHRMGHLIDGLLSLARVTRSEMNRDVVNLSNLAQSILDELRLSDPAREIEVSIQRDLTAWGDSGLLRSALENLLGNAWKFSRKSPQARIEFGQMDDPSRKIFFVRDKGAGFDMAYYDKLFVAFQRLHPRSDFEGTGIGLATVQRVIHRHGGTIWAESAPGKGTTFFFSLAHG